MTNTIRVATENEATVAGWAKTWNATRVTPGLNGFAEPHFTFDVVTELIEHQNREVLPLFGIDNADLLAWLPDNETLVIANTSDGARLVHPDEDGLYNLGGWTWQLVDSHDADAYLALVAR